MSAVEVALGLGSNIGDKAGHIRRAVAALVQEGVLGDVRLSALYRTAPWGHVTDQDWFVNACAVGTTTLAPAALLDRCKAIESRLGRTETVRWGPRVIDIDILFHGDGTLDTPRLTVPHKEMLRRAFVLVPLAELRPDKRIGGLTVAQAAAALPDTADIVRLAEASDRAPRLRLIRRAALASTPWKNGGGSTAEIAIWPAQAGFDDFGWRLSMADVASDGPFSSFPNIDRTLVVLDGAGLVLDVAGTVHRLDETAPALSFSGDAPTLGRLIDGPVRDFNVMTRRGRFTHAVRVVSPGRVAIAGPALLLAHRGAVRVSAGDVTTGLNRLDAVMVEGPADLTVDGDVLFVELHEARSV